MAIDTTTALYSGAQFHPGARRVGPAIHRPFAVVVHTTDMLPKSFGNLIKAQMNSPGPTAHVFIGRDETQGVHQIVPFNRNGEHAGGEVHGWWRDATGRRYHPNECSIGIEVHSGGLLKIAGGRFIHDDTGTVISPLDVVLDRKRRSWHFITEYSKTQLRLLLSDLRNYVATPPNGLELLPNATYASQGVAGSAESVRKTLVGHWTLDPINKTDPGYLQEFVNTLALEQNWK